MCLRYSTTSGSWKWSGSVVQNQVQNQLDSHSCLPFTQDCRGWGGDGTGAGRGRHKKQTKNNKNWVLGRRGKFWILSSACCQGNPSLLSFAILFIMLVWLSLERSDIGDLLLYRGWFEPVIYIYLFYSIPNVTFFFFFFFRLWQGVRSSQGKEFKKEINATIDTSYVSGEEECEFVVYKQSFSTSNTRGFLDIMTFVNSVLLCQPHAVHV